MNSTNAAGFFTPTQAVESELVVKHSRFIAWLMPCATRAAIDGALENRRQKFPDATHHCFAWRLGFGEAVVAFSSDAGEPSGTAGKPILQALESRRLTNVICVVSRYFGGTKLGTGGLMRAYSAAAFAAIDRAILAETFPVATLSLYYDYAFAGAVEKVLHQINARVLSQKFAEKIFCAVEVRLDTVNRVRELLMDACSGRITIE